jgi:hypothetical protein
MSIKKENLFLIEHLNDEEKQKENILLEIK